MVFLYTVLLAFLGLLKAMVARRAAYLEKRYTRIAGEVGKRAHEAGIKPGNGTPRDDLAALSAKRQYELGLLASRRDRLEAKHFHWQAWNDRLTRSLDRLRNWKGKKLPYTMGAVDILLAMSLVDGLGMGRVISVQRVYESASAHVRAYLAK
ncbi:MAG TPA: hypothetical protein VHR72_03480 [Gemmataceae bacterium]|jgi:hypothetical protein|nr:hypothetical protein [Gemmataceae bacterium]